MNATVQETVQEVVRRASTTYGVSEAALYAPRGDLRVVDARQAAWYVLSRFRGLYLREIAEAFERDHTTVHKGIVRASKRMNADEATRLFVMDLAQHPVADSLMGMKRALDAEIDHAREVLQRLEALRARLEREINGRKRTVLAS